MGSASSPRFGELWRAHIYTTNAHLTRATANITTVDLLDSAAADHPDLEAFVEFGRRMTFAQFRSAVGALAGVWQRQGVRKGDVVAVSLPACIDYAICYHAAMRLGAITTGLNPRLGRGEVRSILSQTAPTVLVTEDYNPALDDAPAVLRQSELNSCYAADPAKRVTGLVLDDPVAIVWTSGTTGQPKGAVYSHRQLRAVCEASWSLGQTFDRRLAAGPFAHMGFMTRPWDEMSKFITTVIPPTPWKAGPTVEIMARERVTVGQGGPTMWRLMLDCPEIETADLSALRIVATGSAAVPSVLVREMRDRLGCPVVIGYSSTESGTVSGTDPSDPPEVVSNTVGRPRHNVEVRIVDDGGKQVPPGEVGHVECRSEGVMVGYWQDPERTAHVLAQDGWLSIGDFGLFDDAGYLVLFGRGSEMYIRGGYNVYPGEVEARLVLHDSVAQVAVVGAPDPVLGQIGVAFVVLGPSAPTVDLAELRRWCAAEISDYKSPDLLVLVDELPITTMAKVDKRALVARASELGRGRSAVTVDLRQPG